MTEELRVELVEASDLHALRQRVLRNDDPLLYHPDARDDEPSSLHYGGFLADRLVVSASFFPSAPPMNPSLTTYQLRYMAADFDVQGRGYGALVLQFAEDHLRARGVGQIWANGRDTALGFYRTVGWRSVEGSEHLSAETDLPHTIIFKRLTGDDEAE
ncbi:MAG TPA: GNAT family N-acetyltransferase [Acidimicrobiales bacterium]